MYFQILLYLFNRAYTSKILFGNQTNDFFLVEIFILEMK